MSVDFKKYMSFEKYVELFDLLKFEMDNKSNKDKEFDEKFKSFINNDFASFLQGKKENNELSTITYSEGHSTNFSNAWNNFIKDNKMEKYVFEMMLYAFEQPFLKLMFAKLDKDITTDDKINSYEELMNVMNKGDIKPSMLEGSDCFECNQRLLFFFRHWKPEITTFKKVNDKYTYTKPDDCIPKDTITLPITFKTGNLLAADWFRIEQFTNLVDYNKDYQKPSINSALGRIMSTKHMVENFNFISVSVSNTCPDIFNTESGLIIGKTDPNELESEEFLKQYKKEGNICTDLWAVTIIEKENLIDLLTQDGSLNLESATDIVNKYLEENSVLSLQIEPGEYYINFHPDYYQYKNLTEEKNINKELTPFFVIKKQELKLDNKKKNKP